jgi:hypothetical protein
MLCPETVTPVLPCSLSLRWFPCPLSTLSSHFASLGCKNCFGHRGARRVTLVPVGLRQLAKPVALGASHIYSLESRTEREDLCVAGSTFCFQKALKSLMQPCEEAALGSWMGVIKMDNFISKEYLRLLGAGFKTLLSGSMHLSPSPSTPRLPGWSPALNQPRCSLPSYPPSWLET